jgi:hypothetical protein
LFNRRIVQKAGVSLPDIEQAIVDNLWDDLYPANSSGGGAEPLPKD